MGSTPLLTPATLNIVDGPNIATIADLSMFRENDIPIVVIDEFNLVVDPDTSRLMAETIKALSDERVKATVIVVDMSDNIEGLIDGHQSITRWTEEVLMPRMAKDEMQYVA